MNERSVVFVPFFKIILLFKIEAQHTRLALLYLEKIQSQSPADSSLRQRFRQFLLKSDLFRARFVLGKLQSEPNMAVETCFLLGKLGDHADALEVLVKKLRDYDAAEEYCRMFCQGRERKERQSLYSLLFRTLMAIRECVQQCF